METRRSVKVLFDMEMIIPSAVLSWQLGGEDLLGTLTKVLTLPQNRTVLSKPVSQFGHLQADGSWWRPSGQSCSPTNFLALTALGQPPHSPASLLLPWSPSRVELNLSLIVQLLLH